MNVLETSSRSHLWSKLPLHLLDGFCHVHSASPRLDAPVSVIVRFLSFPLLANDYQNRSITMRN